MPGSLPATVEPLWYGRHPVLALGPAMAAARAASGFAGLVSPDGVHLKPGGELVYARTIFAELDRLGWIPDKE